MATLNEIYDEVDAHVDTLSRIVGEDRIYMIQVTIAYKTSASTSQSIGKWIMVKDRGGAGEKAYWEGSKPSYLTVADTFPDLLAAQLIAYKITNPTFEIYEVIDCHNADKWAMVRAWVYDSGTQKSTIKNYLFFKIGANWFTREVI